MHCSVVVDDNNPGMHAPHEPGVVIAAVVAAVVAVVVAVVVVVVIERLVGWASTHFHACVHSRMHIPPVPREMEER